MISRHLKRRILIVDDDSDILDLLEYNLYREGYEVKKVRDAQTALQAALSFFPDLIILDIMMPVINGVDLCQALRMSATFSETYIFLLTASTHSYQELAYRGGADDYIEKMSGLKSLLRKISIVLKSDIVIRKRVLSITFGCLGLSRVGNKATVDGRTIKLSDYEFELLFLLVQNAGKHLSEDAIISCIWGSRTFLGEPNLRPYFIKLQEKFGMPIVNSSSAGFFISLV